MSFRSAVKVVVVALMASACAGRNRPAPAPTAPSPSPAPAASPVAMRFTATAYCQGTITATGTRVARGTIAADPSVLPFGTVVRLEGLDEAYNGEYTVLDAGPKVRGRRVDVYMASCREATQFGRRPTVVTIVGRDAVER